MGDRRSTFWAVQVPGWFLAFYLIYAQGIPAIDYEVGVRMGTQEPAAVVTEVGVAFWKGFALADLIVYIPVLMIGLVGFWRAAIWGRVLLAAALGITVYWPVVVLVAAFNARNAVGWHLADTAAYWTVLPIIALWGAFSLYVCAKQ